MPATERRPTPADYAPYYQPYVDLVPDGPIVDTLRRQVEETLALLRGVTPERAEHRYAPGKWSVKEVLGHVADAERIFAYRALRIARGDSTPLPGFDENAFVAAAGFGARTLPELMEEFRTARQANVSLFESFDEAALARRGRANDVEVSVRGLLYITAGHELHHREILRERYL